MTELPEKPSGLLRMALPHLRSCENDLDYKIDMGGWHMPGIDPGDMTRIDLAGAVMAREFGVSKHDHFQPGEFGENAAKLQMLAFFSLGDVGEGVSYLGYDIWDMDFAPPDYAKDKDAWHERMQQLADDLQARGL